MKRLPPALCLTLLMLGVTAHGLAYAQQPNPIDASGSVVPPPEARPSPLMLTQVILPDSTYLKVVYGSPRKRGRDVFGALVPYGEVWRLGANEATEIVLTKDVTFGGEPLQAGTYSLFAIPGEETWTIAVNSVLGQWGAFEYQPDKDVLRVEVPAGTLPQRYEAFTMALEEADGGANLAIMWDTTKVVVPITPR